MDIAEQRREQLPGRVSLSDSMREEIAAAASKPDAAAGRPKQQREQLMSWDLDITLYSKEDLVGAKTSLIAFSAHRTAVSCAQGCWL